MFFLNKAGVQRLWAHIVARLNEKVSTTTTINGKALTENITLSASDVGADASGTASTAASDALTSAKAYTDEQIDSIKEGDITVAEATHATSADTATKATTADSATTATKANTADSATTATTAASATKATQDASGNVITSTYETKVDAAAKLTDAKAYTDDAIDALGDTYYTEAEIDSKVATLNSAISGKASSSHTHSAATTDVAGFMSASDKSKLDGIAAGANAYTLPSAGTSLGGVKSGGDVTISSGVITVNDDSHNHVISNIDGLQDTLDSKAATDHSHDDTYYTESEVDSKLSTNLSSAKTYADDLNTAIDSRMNTVESKLSTVASGAEVNQNAFANVVVGSTTIAADAKSDSLTIAAGTGISVAGDATNDKVTITNSGVRSISTGGTNGTISVNTNGTSAEVAVKGLGSAAYTNSSAYATSSHTHSSYANQNAFSNVKVGSTTIAADTTTDTLTITAGSNVTITPDTTNDAITIAATDTTYSAGTGISLSGTTFSNSGVRSISTGSSNGTISVNTNGTSANVAVKGLGSAAYTASTAYDAAGTAATKADAALASAKTYTDEKIDALVGEGASETLDTIGEISAAIEGNQDMIDTLNSAIGNKANASDLTSHTSNKSNPHGVTLAQLGVTATAAELNKLDGVTATTAELNIMDGVTATTAEINYLDGVTSGVQAQLDSKASSSSLTSHTGNTTSHLTSTERTNWNAAYTHSQTAHAPSNAQANQNAFSNVTIGDTTIAADTTTDTLTLVGSNVTLTPDATNDKVTIGITKANVTSALGYTPPTTNTTYSAATTSAAGLMSAADKTKLNGIATGAEVNQNAFSNVVVGDTTIAADSKTDTLTFIAGSNVTLTPNATGDSITISSTDTNTVYTHPTTSGNKHIPSGGSSGQILRWSADGTAAWGADNNTTYSAATQSAQGLMSAADKTKLDGIATGANAYTLPTASSSTLGGVKTTSTVTSTSGLTACPIISGVPYYKDTNTTYSLGSFGITATATELNYMDGVTSNVQTQLNSKAASSHTHSSYVNQNAFSNVTVGSTTIAADSATDTLTFAAGSNITLTPDADNDKITITAKDTTYSAATTSAAGLMSAADKSKLDAITASADAVSFSRSLTSGTKVGTITINGTGTDLYAPTNTDTHYTSKNVVGSSTATSNTTTALTNGNVYLNSVENGAVTSAHKISGSGATTVTTDTSGNIVVSSTNTTYGAAGTSLGLVKSGGDVTISSGVITVNDDSHNHTIANIDNLQSTLDGKQATITGGATTITSSNLTASRALVSDSNGKVAVSAVTSTELGYLDGVTSAIQTQLNNKSASSHNHGLLHTSFTKQIDNTTTDSGWSMINDTYSGYILKSLRTQKNAPEWTLGDFSAGVAFGGADTKGVVTLAYSSPKIKFAGGNGDAPVWNIGMTGTSGTTYNLNNMPLAATATKLGSSTVGGAAKPIYLSSGTATACSSTVGSSTLPVYMNAGTITSCGTSLGVSVTGSSASCTGNSATATALTTSAGDYNTPVYFSSGKPVACTYLDLDTTGSSASCTGNSATATKFASYQKIELTGDVTGTAMSQAGWAVSTTVTSEHGVSASSSDGVAYTATVSGIDSLTAGVSFIMIPATTSTSTTPTLNVNDLGAKNIKRRLSTISTSAQSGYSASWLASGKPFRVTYDGTQWMVEGMEKPVAADLYGTLAVGKGGTGTTTAPTQGGVIYASSTSAYASTAAGTSGYVLKSNGTSAPTWMAQSSIAAGSATTATTAKVAESMKAITASSSDGVAYTATVSGITSLTAGVSFIMIPNRVSASTRPTLDVNSLGAKGIRRRISDETASWSVGCTSTWLCPNYPIIVTYDGTYWLVESMTRPLATDLYGTLDSTKCVSLGLLDIIYPVGSIYMSVNNTSPASFFGGTWEQIKDTFLLSAGDTYAAGATGGEATHTLTVDETPAHNHTPSTSTAYFGTYSGGLGSANISRKEVAASSSSGLRVICQDNDAYDLIYTYNKTSTVGADGAHNNMPPYLTVYMWKRTA